MLKIGMPAPDFIGKSTQGTLHLKDYIGQKNIILVFYPETGCQLCQELQAALEELTRLDTVIWGCNQKSLEIHLRVAREQGYTFPLISDPDLAIAQKFDIGILSENADYIENTVYIIDLDGVICYATSGNPPISELIKSIENALY